MTSPLVRFFGILSIDTYNMGNSLKDSLGKLLPKVDHTFKATLGKSASFKSRLYRDTKHGELSNLADNRKAIMDVVKKRESQIRKGKYGRRQRIADLKEIAKSSKVTKEDKKEIKALLEALAKGGGTSQPATPKPKVKNTPERRDLPKALKRSGAVSIAREPATRLATPDVLAKRQSTDRPTSPNMPYKPGRGNVGANLPTSGSAKSEQSSSARRPKLVN